MRKIIFLMAWLSFVLPVNAYAYDDGDFQFWNTEAEEFKINSDLKLGLDEEFRWGGNASEFFYQHYDAGLFYNMYEHLNVGGGYRLIYELKNKKFKQENSPYITASLLWVFKWIKFEDKNRLEYRQFDYQADSGRYRNKLTAKLPWKFTALNIQPYLSDEILFLMGGTNQLSQNRFSTGIGMDIAKNIKGDVYYMLLSARSPGEWKDSNVLGTKLKFSF